eukprot:gene13100-13227_t
MGSNSTHGTVGVGIGVIVQRGEDILLGIRQGSLGEGEWALPGGHLEHGETFEECAMREVLEETGVAIHNVQFAAAENVLFESGAHYVVIFMHGEAALDAEAVVLEPHKCRGWSWVRWEQLPSPLFKPLQQLVDHGLDGAIQHEHYGILALAHLFHGSVAAAGARHANQLK